MEAEPTLRMLLQGIGTVSLTALIFVAVPYSWMNSIHRALGMGSLPDAPVVGYLARSTSAFYALLGGLFWVISLDPGHHRQVLIYIGAAVTLLGVVLTAIDWLERLPLWWRIWEGPMVAVLGGAILYLSLQLG